jgi:hypothetical protein
MKQYVTALVFALLAVAIVSFGQQIIVRDNASTTAPVDQTRVFGSGYTSTVAYREVATTSALIEPTLSEAILFQFNTDDKKLYIRLLDSNGDTYGCVATLSDDLTSALN